tara:strand:- start:5077 stop:6819 length:1743 start_codon:yes stop_codon:yes gene_type:complete
MKTYFSIENLRIAWERCRRDTNRDIKDYAGMDLFEVDLDNNLNNLSEILLSKRYKPCRPAKFYEPKPSGTLRSKTILCIEDALVYQCIIDTIAARSYEDSLPYESFVFGSVLNEEVSKGVNLLKEDNPKYFFFEMWMDKWAQFAESVNKEIEDLSITYKLETDITGFFDCIPHSKLLLTIYQKYDIDKSVVDILAECLNMWSGTADSATPGIGIPQGPQASFFLGNLYLLDMDYILVKKGLSYYRYMDDIRIYSSDKAELNKVLVDIDKHLKSNGLSINSKKTLIEPISENREEEKLNISDLLFYLNEVKNEMGLKEGKGESKNLNIKKKVEFYDLDITEQFGPVSESDFEKGSDFYFNSKEEADEYLQKQLKEVKEVINARIEFKKNGVSFKNEMEIDQNIRGFQKEWLKIGYDYRSILKLSKVMELGYNPDIELIDVWLIAADKFFSKANQFNWILIKYPCDNKLKKKLMAIIEKSSLYEWVQYQYIITLAVTQKLTLEELRKYFKQLSLTSSFYLKLGLYRLLILQADSGHQLYATIIHSIKSEKDTFLKSTLLYYIDKKNKGILTKYDIAQTIGLI